MTSLQECNARAELCRQFARLEPNSKNVWLAEADGASPMSRCRGRCDMANQPRHGGKVIWKHWKLAPIIAGA
jgi:hypothetical protein